MRALRAVVVACGLVAAWQALVWLTGVESFILPGPALVAEALMGNVGLLARHAWVTILEIIAGLALGTLLGMVSALVLAHFRPARLCCCRCWW